MTATLKCSSMWFHIIRGRFPGLTIFLTSCIQNRSIYFSTQVTKYHWRFPSSEMCPMECSWARLLPGIQFNIKMSSYQYRKSHSGDKTVVTRILRWWTSNNAMSHELGALAILLCSVAITYRLINPYTSYNQYPSGSVHWNWILPLGLRAINPPGPGEVTLKNI